MSELHSALSCIDRFVCSLPDTGARGFEGLVVELCEAITGQTFRISGAGQQDGQDARSETAQGNRIKIEAKHFLKVGKSRLRLRELLGELEQAISSWPGLDLWVLVASHKVNDQHATRLEQMAQERGVEVLFLDLGTGDLPRLAVLMAGAEARVESWATRYGHSVNLPDLRRALELVRADTSFLSAHDQLVTKFMGTALGYDDAKFRNHNWLMSTLSQERDVKARFGQRIGIRDSTVRKVRRDNLCQTIDEWWNGDALTGKHAIAVGEEGTGKTWGVFDWLASAIESNSIPIVLPFNAAADVRTGETLETLLPRLLAKWTRIETDAFWMRRLEGWMSAADAPRPLILLLADGLNERVQVNWPDFFRSLNDSRWNLRVVVLATDRTQHWNSRCSALTDFLKIPVDSFSPAELSEALEDTGISIDQIPADLHPLIRNPRYCHLVCRHFAELLADADFTVERLFLLDARQRTSELRGAAMTTDEFLEVIIGLVSRQPVKTELSLADISALPFAAQNDQIRQEILDGGLLEPVPGHPTRYRLKRDRLVFGLGLVMSNEVQSQAKQGASADEVSEFLQRSMEPEEGADLRVAILSATLVFAFQVDYPELGRRELLRSWLGLRNWDTATQEGLTHYVLRRPQDFVEMAEYFWSTAHDHGAAQEFLGNPFVSFRDDPRVLPTLQRALDRWMRLLHPAGHPLLRRDQDREKRQREKIQLRLGRPVESGQIEVAGEKLIVVEDDGLLRLALLSLRIMSAGDRRSFIGCLVPWSVVSSVVGGALDFETAAWVVRMAPDEIGQDMLTAANRLMRLPGPLTKESAVRLLQVLGTSSARAMAGSISLPIPDHIRQWRENEEADPCLATRPWSETECVKCLDRRDIHPVSLVEKLGDRVYIPGYHLPDSLLARCEEHLNVDPATIHVGLGSTREEHFIRALTPVLGSQRPRTIADYCRSVVRTLPKRELGGQYPLALWLPRVSLLLGQPEIDSVLGAARRLATDAAQWQTSEHKGASGTSQATEAMIVLGIAARLNPDQLSEVLLTRPVNAEDQIRMEAAFGPVSEAKAQEILHKIHSSSDPVFLRRALWVLASTKLTLSGKDRDRIVALAESPDSVLREMAARFAVWQEDEVLGRRIVELGKPVSNGNDWLAYQWGVELLIRHSGDIAIGECARRLDSVALGSLLARRGNRPEEICSYALALDTHWVAILQSSEGDVHRLPEVTIAPKQGRPGELLQPIPEARPGGLDWRDPSISWRSSKLPKLVLPVESSEAQVKALNRRSVENAEALRAAWKTQAHQWRGRRFCRAALEQIHLLMPDIVHRWVAPALADGLSGELARERLATFLVEICLVLLEREPSLGWRLLQKLGEGHIGRVLSDITPFAFVAAHHQETTRQLGELAIRCNSDAALASFARSAVDSAHKDWLREIIDDLVQDARLWRKGHGLTLASFSDLTLTEFDSLVQFAAIDGSWIGDQVEWLRSNVRRNEYCRHWYRTFLEEEDFDVAWGAWQMVLGCGDGRFFSWRTEIEKHGGVAVGAKLRFLEAQSDHIDRRLQQETKKLRERTLYGIRTEREQVFPFIDSR